MISIILLSVGVVALVVGANWLVQGASKLACNVGIPPLVIGLTVVAFGTSAPELAVSVASAAANAPEIAIGNVIGSNIFNILLILGISSLITPLLVAHRLVKIDIPLMVLASLATWWCCADGNLSRAEGAALFSALVIYTIWLVVDGRREQPLADLAPVANPTSDQSTHGPTSSVIQACEASTWKNTTPFQITLIVVGLISLVVGSQMMVSGAVSIAQYWGISTAVIGLTIVAGGTSLPEVATSIMAAWAGEKDIAVGNVIGSNLFNLLGVLGLSSIVSQSGLPVAATFLQLDIPVMVLVACVLLPMALGNRKIGRISGSLLLAGYIAYTFWLIRAATIAG